MFYFLQKQIFNYDRAYLYEKNYVCAHARLSFLQYVNIIFFLVGKKNYKKTNLVVVFYIL
jgi:hypothetical protein